MNINCIPTADIVAVYVPLVLGLLHEPLGHVKLTSVCVPAEILGTGLDNEQLYPPGPTTVRVTGMFVSVLCPGFPTKPVMVAVSEAFMEDLEDATCWTRISWPSHVAGMEKIRSLVSVAAEIVVEVIRIRQLFELGPVTVHAYVPLLVAVLAVMVDHDDPPSLLISIFTEFPGVPVEVHVILWAVPGCQLSPPLGAVTVRLVGVSLSITVKATLAVRPPRGP